MNFGVSDFGEVTCYVHMPERFPFYWTFYKVSVRFNEWLRDMSRKYDSIFAKIAFRGLFCCGIALQFEIIKVFFVSKRKYARSLQLTLIIWYNYVNTYRLVGVRFELEWQVLGAFECGARRNIFFCSVSSATDSETTFGQCREIL